MKMVVTGTGRSGTGWAAATLNSAGVFAGHEAVFTPRTVKPLSYIDWCGYRADCSWLAVPRLPLMNVKVALIVRNPLDVVASMAHIRFGVGMHDNDHAEIARQYANMEPSLDGYLRFWLEWNQRALANAEAIFTLDQLLENPMTLTRWAGAKYEPKDVGVVNDRPEWKGETVRPDIEWDSFTDHAAVYQAQSMWNSLTVKA